MDAFYASVEQRDHPEYRGKPIAVGGAGKRGVVATASYEARKFGVHSAMASVLAYRKCPEIIFVKPRFDVYKQVSRQVREVFFEYTDLVEPLSLDEAYLDVTENKPQVKSATIIAQEIKQKIKQVTGLTASAGVSFNKFLAKIASDYQKPDGLTVITPKEAPAFIDQLPVSKIHGIGKVTAHKMHELGIFEGKDLKSWDRFALIRHFGKSGIFYYNLARAEDERKVNPHRIRKSVSVENTYTEDIQTKQGVYLQVEQLAELLLKRIEKSHAYGRTLTVKIKFDDFKQITRSKTVAYLITSESQIREIAKEIIEQAQIEDKAIRLLGIGVSNLDPVGVGVQLTLFSSVIE
ncbi:DNA polymerase IV [Rapidithrix thailandica]